MKQYIETIRVNNEDINHPHQIASHFNNFFIELSHVRDKTTVNRNHEVSISTSTNNNNMLLMSFSENEIINVIASLNNTQAVGFDEICTHVIKECKAELCTIITHLVNSSFESGIFPELLKTSIVKPLFKKNDKKDMGNYRPITLIPIFAKLFEKCMYKRLIMFLNKESRTLTKKINRRHWLLLI